MAHEKTSTGPVNIAVSANIHIFLLSVYFICMHICMCVFYIYFQLKFGSINSVRL
jgi:hypothetical protein